MRLGLVWMNWWGENRKLTNSVMFCDLGNFLVYYKIVAKPIDLKGKLPHLSKVSIVKDLVATPKRKK